MMKMYIAATALAALIGVPAQAQAGCGCSGKAQVPVAQNAPLSLYDAGRSFQAGSSSCRTASSALSWAGCSMARSHSLAPSYMPAPVYSTPSQYSTPPSPMSMSAPPTTAGSHPPAGAFTSPPFADTPNCCANGGSSYYADGVSSCCPAKPGTTVFGPPGVATRQPLRSLTKGKTPWLTLPAASSFTQAPPMPMSSATHSPAATSAPTASDPHAGHQH